MSCANCGPHQVYHLSSLLLHTTSSPKDSVSSNQHLNLALLGHLVEQLGQHLLRLGHGDRSHDSFLEAEGLPNTIYWPSSKPTSAPLPAAIPSSIQTPQIALLMRIPLWLAGPIWARNHWLQINSKYWIVNCSFVEASRLNFNFKETVKTSHQHLQILWFSIIWQNKTLHLQFFNSFQIKQIGSGTQL